MTDSTLPSHIGNKVTTTDKDKVEWHSEIVDEIVRIQSNAPHIALCLQLLKPARLDDPIEVRFCYYYAKDEGGWGFARNPPMMPPSDFFAIVDEAIKKSWDRIKLDNTSN